MRINTRKDLTCAKNTYQQAFPKYERLPWWVLRLTTLHKDIDITSFFDDCNFIGFTHTTITNEILFIMFFAIRNDLQGKGYGSEILKYFKEKYPNHAITLNVEPLDEKASNATQRMARMKFYQKNGFFDTGYNIDEVGGTFQVLSTKQHLDFCAYRKVFQKLSIGLWHPKITYRK